MKHQNIVRTGLRMASALAVVVALSTLGACASESNLRMRSTTEHDNVRISSGEGGASALRRTDDRVPEEDAQSVERLIRDRERARGGRF